MAVSASSTIASGKGEGDWASSADRWIFVFMAAWFIAIVAKSGDSFFMKAVGDDILTIYEPRVAGGTYAPPNIAGSTSVVAATSRR